jgi:hypothetical protein
VELTQQGQALKIQAVEIPNKIKCKFNSMDGGQVEQLVQLFDLVVEDLAESQGIVLDGFKRRVSK